eukprot:CAMPEP_0118666812 /NCGR_PEP_ID=MMETSP0785-20121206/19428_1 /TAXON_ID=91992 /ORGANISM="Bolidomonas pacifica, Strain CCMP 1866" /LENGTH=2849 /DNA_ID=CAMNT_0006561175 /DNA_START=172 /DNA_END=8724 /DNA_ORIENTATION=+
MNEYDAEADPYNPYTRTEKFRKHMRRQKKLESLQHKPKARTMSESRSMGTIQGSMRPMDGNSLSMMGDSSKMKGPSASALSVRNMSTISGGVTFSQFAEAREETVNPGAELSVLKAVLLREGYLRRLVELGKESSHTLSPGLGDLLDIIRISSVEVVEAIAEWRKGLTKPVPFMWNGINYLVKMPSDLDFLNLVKPLTSWLGFSMERNPFVIPLPMEQRPGTGAGKKKGDNNPLLTGHSSSEGANADPGFTSIGGVVTPHSVTHTETLSAAKKSRKSHSQTTPYATPIVNDPDLINDTAVATSKKGSPSRTKKSKTTHHQQQHVTPSTIGDLDMLRLRQAEKTILAEEAIHGQYLRDHNNRLVPAWQAERERFADTVAVDDHRPLSQQARIPEPAFAPFAEQSGFGLDPMQPGDENTTFTSSDDTSPLTRRKQQRSKRRAKGGEKVQPPPGRARANKIGGELHTLTTAGTSGRKKAPARRSRGAILDMDITRKEKENQELENQLMTLKSDLKIAQGALGDMEEEIESVVFEDDEEKEQAATIIQSEIRQVEAKTKVDTIRKKREQVEAAKQLVLMREKELIVKKRELAEKKKQREDFKKVEKRSQDARRARELERKRRKLDENQILPEDEEEAITLEDISATSIQRISRGRQARAFYKKYKELCERSATIIQGGTRGMFDRKIVRERRKEQWAATTIKRLYRGKMARLEFKNLLLQRTQARAAIKIQTIMRGKFGKQRMQHKRALVTSAKRAFNSVSVRMLFPADLQELADSIQLPLVDLSKPYLPAAVLGLIKIVCLALGAEDKGEKLAHYSRIGVRADIAVSADMTWETAMKVLRRSSKLLRRMRALSSGPANRRPRLLHLPEKAVEMFRAYEHDPSFTVDAMRRIGKGAKACIQLLTWCSSLFEVFDYQLEFLDDIGDVQAGWIQKLREQQKEKRKIMVQLEVKKRAVSVAADAAARAKSAGKAFGTAKSVMVESARLKVGFEKALEKMQWNEDIQKKKESNESDRVTKLAEDSMVAAERDVLVAKSEFKKAETEANLGSELDRNRLPKLRAHLIECEVVLRDAKTQYELCKIREEKDSKKRQECLIELDGELLYRCSACGEAEALYKVAKEEKRLFAEKHGGMKSLESVKGRDKDELDYIDQRMESAKKRLEDMEALLKHKVEVFELETKKKYDAEAMADAAPQGWDTPTEEEIEEDRREDEVMAQEEKERMKEFVSTDILNNKAERPRPLLVCVARDIPMVAKQKIIGKVLSNLEGMFVRVSLSENQGIDIAAFQAALDAGSSIVADVDVGISMSARSTFLNAVAVAKKALIPNPMCLVLTGDLQNRKGNGSEVHLGVAEADLRVMKDGDLKRRLQIASHCERTLCGKELVDDMVDLSLTEGPPSATHVLILEACVVILSPKARFRHPDKNVAGVSWQSSRRTLADYKTLQKEIANVDKSSIPEENLVVLQEYLSHENWPAVGKISNATDPLLSNLHTWITSVVEYAAMLRAGGGKPEILTRRNPLNLFSAVINVKDAETAIQEEDESSKIGWKAAYSQMVAPLLEDVRVYREARNINGDIHTINVYLDCNRVFFSAYNPQTSVNFVASIHIREINGLLAPNSVERSEFGNRAPPHTREEMFSRLVHLLVLERQSRLLGYRKTLACKRKLKRILRETRRISGHLATITVSEDSLGELRCQAYLPQFSADLELVVRLDMLFDVLPNADRKLELEQFKSDDAMALLRPVTDRLAINPRLRTINDMGMDPVRRYAGGASEKKRGGGKGGKGLFLGMRLKGGCSRTLFEKTHKFAGVMHLVTVGEVGRGGMLRIRAYNPISCEQHEIRISEIDRALVMDGSMGDWRKWEKELFKRLSLRRISKVERKEEEGKEEEGEGGRALGSGRMDTYPEDTRLDFNRTIFTTAVKISGVMFAARVVLGGFIDVGDSIEIRIVHLSSSEEHVLTFSEDDMKKIAGLEEREGGVIKILLADKESREAVLREMLKYVKYAEDKDQIKFISEFMEHKDAIKNASKEVVKVDEGRLKIVGVEKIIKKIGVDELNLVADVGDDLKRVVVRGRRQGYCKEFSSGATEVAIEEKEDEGENEDEGDVAEGEEKMKKEEKEKEIDWLPEECFDEEGNAIDDLYEFDKANGFDYKPLGLRFARGEEELPEVGEALLSPTLNFEKVVSESVQVEGGDVVVVDETPAIVEAKKVQEEKVKEKDALDMLKENRLLFNQGVKVKHGVIEALQYEVGMVMKVYESYDENMDRQIRLEMYSPNNSGKGIVYIRGETDLREVVGPHVEELLLPENEEEMFHHIAHNRMKIADGLWNEDTELYEKNDDMFTVILTRNRLYKNTKATPLGMGGAADQEANRDVLIDRRAFRGRKLLRKAIKVSGVLLQVQIFEIMPLDETENKAPSLRFLAYDPATGHKMVLEVPGAAVEEVIVKEKKDLITETSNRYALADEMCSHLKLLFPRGMPPELVLPWSGGRDMDDLGDDDSKNKRPVDEKNKRSTDLLMRAGFSLQHLDGHVTYDAIVSVFVHKEVENALRVNIYVPRISESCEVAILEGEQKRVLHGRKAISYPRGEPIITALGNVVRCLKLSIQDDPKIEKKKNLIATFIYKEGKPWHAAYTRLETDDEVVKRPAGQGGVVFIPADTRGDLILRKGVKVSNMELLVSVSTRARGEKAGHGLVLEAYDPATSVNIILHVVASELKRIVNGREDVWREESVEETCELLLYLLVVEKGPTGHLVMKLDSKVMPDLFLTEEEKQERKKQERMKELEERVGEGGGEGRKYEEPLMPDLDKTTSVSFTSGPQGFVGSKVMKPGEIHYVQGEGGEVKEEKAGTEEGEEGKGEGEVAEAKVTMF